MDPEGRDQVTVEVKVGNETVKIPWKKYIEDHLDKSQHELIRRNVLLATRNFQHRVETFRREVIFGRNNPLKVRHISYRVEFQGRGAGHIHGVLWLDLKEMKIKVISAQKHTCYSSQTLGWNVCFIAVSVAYLLHQT